MESAWWKGVLTLTVMGQREEKGESIFYPPGMEGKFL